MYNPLAIFDKKLLHAFIQQGHKYFIRQTFNRAKNSTDENIRGYFLISQYDDLYEAQQHMSAIKNDPNKFLYELENEEHKKKLLVAASKPEGFNIYANVLTDDWRKRITTNLEKKIRYYLEHHRRWYPKRSDAVDLNVFVQFGTLFAQINWKHHEIKVSFDEIEKMTLMNLN